MHPFSVRLPSISSCYTVTLFSARFGTAPLDGLPRHNCFCVMYLLHITPSVWWWRYPNSARPSVRLSINVIYTPRDEALITSTPHITSVVDEGDVLPSYPDI